MKIKNILKFIKKYGFKITLIVGFGLFFSYKAIESYAFAIWKNYQSEVLASFNARIHETDSLPPNFKQLVETICPLHKKENHRLLLDCGLGFFMSPRGPYGKYEGYGVEHYSDCLLREWGNYELTARKEWNDPIISEGLAFSLYLHKNNLQETLVNLYYLNRRIPDHRFSENIDFFNGIEEAAYKLYGITVSELNDAQLLWIYTLFEPKSVYYAKNNKLVERYNMNIKIYNVMNVKR